MLSLTFLFSSLFAFNVALSGEFFTWHETAREDTVRTGVTYFLDAEADVNAVGDRGAISQIIAARNSHSEFARALIASDGIPNARAIQGGVPFLLAAVDNSNPRVVQFQIDADAGSYIETIAAEKRRPWPAGFCLGLIVTSNVAFSHILGEPKYTRKEVLEIMEAFSDLAKREGSFDTLKKDYKHAEGFLKIQIIGGVTSRIAEEIKVDFLQPCRERVTPK